MPASRSLTDEQPKQVVAFWVTPLEKCRELEYYKRLRGKTSKMNLHDLHCVSQCCLAAGCNRGALAKQKLHENFLSAATSSGQLYPRPIFSFHHGRSTSGAAQGAQVREGAGAVLGNVCLWVAVCICTVTFVCDVAALA